MDVVSTGLNAAPLDYLPESVSTDFPEPSRDFVKHLLGQSAEAIFSTALYGTKRFVCASEAREQSFVKRIVREASTFIDPTSKIKEIIRDVYSIYPGWYFHWSCASKSS